MLSSRTSTPPAKLTTLSLQRKTAAVVAKVSAAPGLENKILENKIRERAHQLYEGRGCELGKDKQDWLQAEHEILKLQP
jgi:Protein of unknown function (DUF2934)